MTDPAADAVRVGRRLLHSLRQVLEREFGDRAAPSLQETGYAAGDELYDLFHAWLSDHTGVADPADLDAEYLDEMLGAFFTELGWGTVQLARIGSATLAIDSANWAEADPDANTLAPGCHVSAGMFAGFLGRLAGQDVAVMEIECLSCNHSRCRFLAGAPETLQRVYEAMAEGTDYQALLRG